MATSGQIVIRPKGQNTCTYHNGKILELFCEQCQQVACMKCVTSRHKGHNMSELCDITMGIKDDIRSFISDTEGSTLPQSEQQSNDVIQEVTNNSEYFDNLEKETKKHAEQLKQEIDVMTAESLSLYQQMRSENAKLLVDYKGKVDKRNTDLRNNLQECKRLLQTASDIVLYDSRDAIKTFVTNIPDKPALQTAHYTPTTKYRGFLDQAFGKRATSNLHTGQISIDDDESHGASNVQQAPPPTQSGPTTTQTSTRKDSGAATKQQKSEYTLLNETKVLDKHKTPYIACSLYCIDPDRVWVQYGGISHIDLLDNKCWDNEKIKLYDDITDISVSPTTHHVWASCGDCTIIECTSSGSSNTRFRSNDEPRSLCVTNDNHVLVGTEGNITKYSTAGTAVLRTGSDPKTVALFPCRLSECPVTQNVVVVNWDDITGYGGEVVVMDNNLHQLFRYCGKECREKSQKQFTPTGVTFDTNGNIVICDWNSYSIILLSGKGQFLKFLYTGMLSPTAVAIDSNNMLWSAFDDDTIKRLQYGSQ